MKPFITDFFGFLAKPQYQELEKFSIRRIWEIYSWISISAIFLGVLIQLVVWYLNIELQNSVQDFVLEASPWSVIFLAVILAPVIEEILFRLPLSTKKWAWILWLILVPGLAVYFGFVTNLWVISWVALFGILIGWLVSRRLETFQRLVTTMFPGLVYLTSIVFGIIHITNYQNIPLMSGGFLVFVLPQIVIGFFLAYTRVRLGFIAAITMHALHNGVLVSISLLALPALDIVEGTSSFETLTSTEQLQITSSNIVALAYFFGIVTGVIWTLVDQWKYKK